MSQMISQRVGASTAVRNKAGIDVGLKAHFIRHGANAAIFFTLAFSLLFNVGVSLVLIALIILVLATKFRTVLQSIRNFNEAFRRSDNGLLCITIIVYCLVNLLLFVHHGGSMREVETSLKLFLLGYLIFNYVKDYSVRFIFTGVAVGAILACLFAGTEIALLDQARADGPTNAIRFGMIAMLFSGLSLVALLFLPKPRWFFSLMAAGAFAGLLACFWSGSRGAIVAIPFMLLLFVPRLWLRWKSAELQLFGIYLATALALFVFDAGGSNLRVASVVHEVQRDVQDVRDEQDGQGEQDEQDVQNVQRDRSVSTRMALAFMSLELFRRHPLLGAGNKGWEEQMSKLMQPDETGSVVLPRHYNQAHNQYLNDLAKGGILRGIAGLALLAVPAFLFLRSRPFAGAAGSLPAFAGFMTCLSFALFCLTESMMSLSMPASVYAILVCYLMAAKTVEQREVSQTVPE